MCGVGLYGTQIRVVVDLHCVQYVQAGNMYGYMSFVCIYAFSVALKSVMPVLGLFGVNMWYTLCIVCVIKPYKCMPMCMCVWPYDRPHSTCIYMNFWNCCFVSLQWLVYTYGAMAYIILCCV